MRWISINIVHMWKLFDLRVYIHKTYVCFCQRCNWSYVIFQKQWSQIFFLEFQKAFCIGVNTNLFRVHVALWLFCWAGMNLTRDFSWQSAFLWNIMWYKRKKHLLSILEDKYSLVAVSFFLGSCLLNPINDDLKGGPHFLKVMILY